MNPALVNISKVLGHKSVMHKVTLDLEANQINCLLGPSGCGKSTLLRIAAGLLSPDDGEVNINPSECAMVFQEPRLLPWLTVAENLSLALPSNTDKLEQKAQIRHVLHQLHLNDIEEYMSSELSGGMAQRVGIARALLRKPKILLMDEPFAALDAFTRTELQTMLIELIAKQHTTCLFVTHDVDEAIRIAHTIFVMKEGEIISHDRHNHQDAKYLKQSIIHQLHTSHKGT